MTKGRTASISDNNCGKCKQKFGKKCESCVQCDGCEAWFHITCANLSETQYKALREIKESFWCCENCFGLAKSMFEAGIHEMKQQMKETMEDIKKSASRDYQQTTNEIKTVKSEVNAVKDTCNSVQETLAAMENKIASFETVVKNLNRNVTYSNVAKKNQVVTVQENPKIQQPNDRRDINKIVIITNADTSTLKNSPQIKKSFFELFPSKRLLFAFRNSQNNLHLEFDNEQDAKEVIEKWSPTFLGTKTSARHPATQSTKHCLLIKEIDKSFSETDITGELESSYNIPKQDFEVRRFKTKEGKELNTVKIDFREAGVRDKLLTDGIFLSKHFYRPQIYEHSEYIRATRCYNCQKFGHIAKTCRLNVKCGNCNQSHRTSECNQPENLECANCEKPHASNSGDCPVYLLTLKKIYESRNMVLPQKLQLKIIDAENESK